MHNFINFKKNEKLEIWLSTLNCYKLGLLQQCGCNHENTFHFTQMWQPKKLTMKTKDLN